MPAWLVTQMAPSWTTGPHKVEYKAGSSQLKWNSPAQQVGLGWALLAFTKMMMDAVWLRLGGLPKARTCFWAIHPFSIKERWGILVDPVLWLSHSTRPAPLLAAELGLCTVKGGKAMSSDVQGHLVFFPLPHTHQSDLKCS